MTTYGRELTSGLQEHNAARVAQSIADDKQEPVWVGDGTEGAWEDMQRFDPHPPIADNTYPGLDGEAPEPFEGAPRHRLATDDRGWTLTGPRPGDGSECVVGHVEQIGEVWHATGPWAPPPEHNPPFMFAWQALGFGLVRTSLRPEQVDAADFDSRELLSYAHDHWPSLQFAAVASAGTIVS